MEVRGSYSFLACADRDMLAGVNEERGRQGKGGGRGVVVKWGRQSGGGGKGRRGS